jgi:hypothetical protein
MKFAKQYLISDAAAAWDQYCVRHLEGSHTWAAMKNLLYSRLALTKHCTYAAFQKLLSAKQGPDQTVPSLGAYIVATCEGTDITDYNKRKFLWIRLRPEICAAVRKGEDYLTFDNCLEAGVEAETALYLDAKYNKAFKSAPKGQATEKARKDKGKGKAYYDFGEGRSLQDALQCSRGGFCGQGRGHGRGSRGQGSQQHQQGDRSGAQGARAPRRPGTCKLCGTFGHWAQDCKTNPEEGPAAFASKQKPSGKGKAQ